MNKVFLALLLSCSVSFGQIITTPGGSAGGGAPGITATLAAGNGFSNLVANAVNGGCYQLGAGTFTVNSSPWPGSILSGTNVTYPILSSKTNVTFIGVPGQTIIDGSSLPGDQLLITNCSGVLFQGITFIGYTNHNITQTPSFQVNGSLWESVVVARSEKVTFRQCRWERHHDQAIIDGAASIASLPPSTNQILITQCSFEDIGGWRTNNPSSNFQTDGAAIGPTGWTIDNCDFLYCLRCIEPYLSNAAFSAPYNNLVVQNCRARNMVEWFISPANSTNTHNALIIGNTAINDSSFSYHGTNYASGGTYCPCIAFYINGGKSWQLVNNQARGNMSGGYFFGNAISLLDDCVVIGNAAVDMSTFGSGSGGFTIGDGGSDAAINASSIRRLTFRDNRANNCVSFGFWIQGGRDLTIEGNYGYRATAYAGASDGAGGQSQPAFRIGINSYSTLKLTNIFMRGNTMVDGGINANFGYAFAANCSAGIVNENNQALGFAANGGFTNAAGTAVSTLGPITQAIATFDLPSINAGQQWLTNTPFAGVDTNYLIELQFPLQFSTGVGTNFLYSGWGSNGTVHVKFHNVGAAAADPANSKLYITARQVAIHGQ